MSFDHKLERVAEKWSKRTEEATFQTSHNRAKVKIPTVETDNFGNERQLEQSRPTYRFGDVSVQAAISEKDSNSAESTLSTCPLRNTPHACPFGGACHSCPAHIQKKSAVSQPGDQYEQEADKMAEQIVQTPQSEAAKEKRGSIQSLPSSSISGQPLPESMSRLMRHRFGFDFDGVKIHADRNAAELNSGMNSRAFAFGKEVYFGANNYHPETTEGRKLIAHELTHVVQQGGAQTSGQRLSGKISPSGMLIQRQLAGGLVPTGVRLIDPTEIDIAKGVYGSGIIYRMVFISNATGLGGRPYTLHTGNKTTTIQVGPTAYSSPGSDRRLLIHELAHSWQCQHGINGNEYMANSVLSQALGGKGSYCYVPGKRFFEYGAEQIANQAENGVSSVVGHMTSATPLAPDMQNVAGLSLPRWEKSGDPGVVC